MSQVETTEPARQSKRELTKAANRQAILDAARMVFAEMGYGATTVRDIIRRTGLASGTFYNYYKSKEEVFHALMDYNALRVRPALHEERAKATTFEEFLRGMFRVFFDFVTDDARAYAMMRANTGAIRVRMDTPEVIAGFDELRRDIDDGIERGIVPKVDPEFLSASVIGIAFEVGDRLVKREKPSPDEAAKFATALIIGGVNALPRLDD